MGSTIIRVTTGIAALCLALSGQPAGAAQASQLPVKAAAPAKPAAPAAEATVGPPVTGIASPCAVKHPYPAGAKPAEIRRQLSAFTGFTLVGGGWDSPANAPLVRLVWETLERLNCTDYLTVIKQNHPRFVVNAAPTRSWAWGDWGLTRADALTLDFAKWQQALKAGDPGRLVRILVHELGHAWSRTPQAQASYNSFSRLYRKGGNFGPYAHNLNENYSEVIGYYVARCAKGNPYDAKKFAPYYNLVKSTVFKGKEFGPAPGTRANCSPRSTTRRPATKPAAPVTRLPKESLEPRALLG